MELCMTFKKFPQFPLTLVFYLVYLSSTVWCPITTFPPSDFMGRKLMHWARLDLATKHMQRPHVLVKQAHHLNQCNAYR